MTNNRLCNIYTAILSLLVVTTACTTSKNKQQAKVKAIVPVSFSKDTSATSLIIKPAENRKMIIENLQVYVSNNTQPGVGVAVKRTDNKNSNVILPHIVNGNVYIFGGLINITLNSGDEAKIEVADIETGKLLNARIVISGTEQ